MLVGFDCRWIGRYERWPDGCQISELQSDGSAFPVMLGVSRGSYKDGAGVMIPTTALHRRVQSKVRLTA